MPKKDFTEQFDDEEVLFVFRKHPIVMRKGLIIGLVVLLLGTVPGLVKLDFAYLYGGLAVGLALAIIFFLPSWIVWWYSVFIVTNQRIIQVTQKGFFNKSVVDLGLNKILATNYEVKGVEATIFGFGTIMLQTYMGDLIVHEIHHPAKVIHDISDVLRSQGIELADIPFDAQQSAEGEYEEV